MQIGPTFVIVCSVRNRLTAGAAAGRWLLTLLAFGAQLAGAQEVSHSLYLNTGRLDTAAPVALRQAAATRTGPRAGLIQFAGPIQPDWYAALGQTGVQILSYIPDNAYLVYGDPVALARAQKLPGVQWHGAFQREHKVHPQARQQRTGEFAIQLVADAAANPVTLALLDQLQLAPLHWQSALAPYVNLIVRLRPEDLDTLANQPDVVSIHPFVTPRLLDERQDQIIAGNLTGTTPTGPGYLAWLASKGFTQAQFEASGFVVDITDSGIDNGTTQPGHFALYPLGDTQRPSRVVYNRLEGMPSWQSTLQGCDGHGNLNAHIVAGYVDQPPGFPHTDTAGFAYGLGVCPFVKVGSSVILSPANYTYPIFANLTADAYQDGARISNNSWGSSTGTGVYDLQAQAYDLLVRDAQPADSDHPAAGNQEMVIVFAAGNDGPYAGTVASPGTAKNVLTVGAAANVRSMTPAQGGIDAAGADGSDIVDSDARNANDIALFSSRGPCADGRIKPDLVAPGTHITGGAPQNSPPPSPAGTGEALPWFLDFGNIFGCDAFGVSALPNSCLVSADDFFPLNQQFYTECSGTSQATPAVAGAGALVRQYFINHGWGPPSPALTKAYLMNSARYLTGLGANDTLPSSNQGMGELNLGMAFDGVPRLTRDQLAVDMFTASGQTRQLAGTIGDPTKPFRVTLAWTDSPGSTVASRTLNNDLDLTVTVGGVTYQGNVFNGANSVTGGIADRLNNVESVFLPAGTTGNFTVTVTAYNITSYGVPGVGKTLNQDFALVIYNSGSQSLGVATGAQLPAGQIRSAYQTTLLATNGTPPYLWALPAGSLPAGLRLNKDGRITGTPRTAGTANFTVKVTDQTGFSATAALCLSIRTGAPVAAPTIMPASGIFPDFVKITLRCRTAPATIGYTLDGTEPTRSSPVYQTALVLTNSTMLKVKAFNDGDADSAIVAASFTITTPAISTTSPLPAGRVGIGYSQQLQVSGGQRPYKWALMAGALPVGLKLSSTGVITGKPTVAGLATFTVQVSDAKGGTAQQTVTLAITD